MRNEPEVALKIVDARIAWVLQHPRTSNWLKSTLQGALEADPLCLANDLEMLRHLLQSRSEALLGACLNRPIEWTVADTAEQQPRPATSD